MLFYTNTTDTTIKLKKSREFFLDIRAIGMQKPSSIHSPAQWYEPPISGNRYLRFDSINYNIRSLYPPQEIGFRFCGFRI